MFRRDAACDIAKHQAKGRAIGQVGMPHDVRLRQRLGCERLERRIHNLAGEVERMYWQLTQCKNAGNFSSPRLLRGACSRGANA